MTYHVQISRRFFPKGEILLAKSLLSSTIKDLAGLIAEVRRALPVPINRRDLRRPRHHPQGGGPDVSRRTPSSLPFPLPARGRQAD